MKYQLLCVFFMMLASYIPRVIPLVFFRKPIKSKFIKSVLYYMPYAVLSSLTFPAIFYSTGDIRTASIGTAVAVVLSLCKFNMALVAVFTVTIVFCLGYAF